MDNGGSWDFLGRWDGNLRLNGLGYNRLKSVPLGFRPNMSIPAQHLATNVTCDSHDLLVTGTAFRKLG